MLNVVNKGALCVVGECLSIKVIIYTIRVLVVIGIIGMSLCVCMCHLINSLSIANGGNSMTCLHGLY